MKMFVRIFALTLSFACSIVTGHGQQLAFERLESLRKGCNMSNWLEAYWVADDQYPVAGVYSLQDIQAMKTAGMNNIRLNVNFERLLSEVPPYSVDFGHEAFAWIDSVLNWTAGEDMMVVLCNHHGWNDLNDFTYYSVSPRVIALWDQLAGRYKNYDPNRLLFEVMNEPPVLLSRNKTRLLMNQVVQVIRAHTVDHTIVVSGALGSHASELPNTFPLPDSNLIYTFHYYEPFYFTHQGASWTPVYMPTGATFPTAIFNDENVMRNHFQSIDNWRTANNIPVYMGEFGSINFADEDSKCNWITLMGELIDQYNMVWSYWDCKYSAGSRFGFFDGDAISPYNIRQCYRRALHLYDDGVPTGVEELSMEEFLISPNPARENITLSAVGTGSRDAGFDMEIHDVMGRPVKSFKSVRENLQIEISDLPAGIYLVSIYRGGRLDGILRFIKY